MATLKNKIDDKTRRPWHRQHRETKKSFDAFQHYLLMDGRRSVRRVNEEMGLNNDHLAEVATRWSWVARVKSFEMYKQNEMDEARINAVIEMEERQAQSGKAMQALAAIELKKILEKAKNEKEGKLSVREVVMLFDTGAKLERQAHGQPGDIIQTHDESNKTAEDAAQRAINKMADILGVEAPSLSESQVH